MAYVMYCGRHGDELAYGIFQGEVTNVLLSTSDILDVYDTMFGL